MYDLIYGRLHIESDVQWSAFILPFLTSTSRRVCQACTQLPSGLQSADPCWRLPRGCTLCTVPKFACARVTCAVLTSCREGCGPHVPHLLHGAGRAAHSRRRARARLCPLPCNKPAGNVTQAQSIRRMTPVYFDLAAVLRSFARCSFFRRSSSSSALRISAPYNPVSKTYTCKAATQTPP